MSSDGTPEWVDAQLAAIMEKNNGNLLGATAAALGAFLSVHGEGFTPKELCSLTFKQAKAMTKDVKEFHAGQSMSLLGVTGDDVQGALNPYIEIEALVDEEEADATNGQPTKRTSPRLSRSMSRRLRLE